MSLIELLLTVRLWFARFGKAPVSWFESEISWTTPNKSLWTTMTYDGREVEVETCASHYILGIRKSARSDDYTPGSWAEYNFNTFNRAKIAGEMYVLTGKIRSRRAWM